MTTTQTSKIDELGISLDQIVRVFDKCTTCNKSMSKIRIPITQPKKLKKQEQAKRLCNKCKKEAQSTDDVITIELKKRGII